MSLLSLSSVLWLLAAAPPPPSASPFTLHEGMPEHFVIDGQLGEWQALPSFTLGAANQVSGRSRVSSAKDLSARLWLALGPEGLAVAGEVHDDHVRIAARSEQVNDDHVEVWLALPAPQMPVIGFTNQLGETEVKTPKDCESLADDDGSGHEDCVTWWKQQVERRKQLTGAFVAQYGLLVQSLVRYGPQDQVGRSHYELAPDGYRFEALIPLAAFPRTAQAPLRDLQVMVDLIDNDEGPGKLETLLSSSSRRKSGEPSTFNTVKLATPLRQGAWPELFERLLQANTKRASYQPGPAVQQFQVWLNPAVGSQQEPATDSPAVVDVDLSKTRLAGKLEDVEVLMVPAVVNFTTAPSTWAVSHRGAQVLDTLDLDDAVLRGVPHGPRLVMLRVQEDTVSRLGTGSCGACSHLNLSSVKMDTKGHFSKPVQLEELVFDARSYTWKASADLSLIEVFTSVEFEDKAHPIPWAKHTWSPKTGEYETQRFELPPLKPPEEE